MQRKKNNPNSKNRIMGLFLLLKQQKLFFLYLLIPLIIIVVLSPWLQKVSFFLIFGLLSIVLSCFLLIRFAGIFYQIEDPADHLFYVHTEDNWELTLHYHAPILPATRKYPVILVHGLASNKHSVDLDKRHGLAYFLKQHGYPVFVVNLRGTKQSYHPSKDAYRDICFDDFVFQDAPSIIRRVRELTGAPKVIWIGHSLGAMILQAFLGQKLREHENVACFISLAGPGNWSYLNNDSTWKSLIKSSSLNPWIDFPSIGKIVSPLLGRFYFPKKAKVYFSKNIDHQTARALSANSLENIPTGLLEQLKIWIKNDEEMSVDRKWDYRQGLKNIVIPSLFMVGKGDMVVVPSSTKFVWENINSKDKKFVLLSKEDGMSSDYCHVSIITGSKTPQEVFPYILEWIEKFGVEEKKRKYLSRFKEYLHPKRKD